MSTNTPNYNLEKPNEEEFYDVNVQNGNMDKIDSALKTLAVEVANGVTEEDLTAIDTKLDGINQGVGEINGKSDQIKQGVDNLNTNVTSVKADVAVVKSDVSSVKTTVNAVNTNVNTINSNLGSPISSASNSTSGNAHSKLNWLLVNSGRVVKSIQRGQKYQTVTSGQSTTIPISTVDISKSLFGISNELFANAATLESNAIVMTNIGNGTSGDLSWWVIEFY